MYFKINKITGDRPPPLRSRWMSLLYSAVTNYTKWWLIWYDIIIPTMAPVGCWWTWQRWLPTILNNARRKKTPVNPPNNNTAPLVRSFTHRQCLSMSNEQNLSGRTNDQRISTAYLWMGLVIVAGYRVNPLKPFVRNHKTSPSNDLWK